MFNSYLKTNYLSILLYALLGLVLSAAGVSITTNLTAFLAVMVLVLAIDFNSAYLMYRSIKEDQ